MRVNRKKMDDLREGLSYESYPEEDGRSEGGAEFR